MSFHEILAQYQDNPDLLENDLRQAVAITQNDMLTDMVHQAEVFMHWAILASHAESAAKRQKRMVEQEILPRARARAEVICAENGRKATVQNLNDVAMSDPEYTVAVKLLEKLQRTSSVMKKVEEAFRQRKDMLQSLNSRQRVELESLPIDKPNKTFFSDSEWEDQKPKKKPPTDSEIQAMADRYKNLRKGK